MKTIAMVAAALLLVGCQNSATVRLAEGQGFVALEGATLLVKQEIRVPAGRARVFLQDGGPGGQSRLLGGFDHYRPHCALEIRTVRHDGFVIRPGSFRVVRVQDVIQPVVLRRPIQVAGLMLADGMDDGGSNAYYEGYHFWLAADDQPDVMRLSCFGVYAEPSDLQPPTLREIDQVLGALAELRR